MGTLAGAGATRPRQRRVCDRCAVRAKRRALGRGGIDGKRVGKFPKARVRSTVRVTNQEKTIHCLSYAGDRRRHYIQRTAVHTTRPRGALERPCSSLPSDGGLNRCRSQGSAVQVRKFTLVLSQTASVAASGRIFPPSLAPLYHSCGYFARK